eukprot:TRINITY_DN2422_c0_g1_i1.p4 TRINITY_DN2422_c0_g1~~TRINITY_DN2422_c0_g1_i1.p4  ORF type:complete len:144 (+),score=17.75 TRINITY_DN2422_c0_g1_i1:1977-2408(+)
MALAKAIFALKREFDLARKKLFINLNHYNEEEYRKELNFGRRAGIDQDLIKQMLAKTMEKDILSPIELIGLCKKNNWYHFYDHYLNTRYLYGSQLYMEFGNYCDTMKFVEKHDYIAEGRFVEFLKGLVSGFLSASAFTNVVSM